MSLLTGGLALLLTGEIKRGVERKVRRLTLTALAVLLMVVGVGFGLDAAYAALLPQLGPVVTPLIFSAAFVGIGMIVLAIAIIGTRRPRTAVSPGTIAGASLVGAPLGVNPAFFMLGRSLGRAVPIGAVLVASLFAGVAAGRRTRRRS